MLLTILVPIVLLLGILTIILVTRNMGRVRIKRSFHWKFIIGYLVLLIIGLGVAETMERKVKGVNLPEAVENEVGFDLYSAIVEELPIPDNLVLAKRSHEVEGEFSIPSFSGAYVLIKRTPSTSRIIEETVYSPELMATFDDEENTYYDLSDQLKVNLPVWDSKSMSIPKQPKNHLEYTFYHDSNILNQFTGEKTSGYSSGTVSGVMTVHLLIPESIEIDIPELDDDQNYYIDLLE